MRIIALEEHIATPLYHQHRPPNRTPSMIKRQESHGHEVIPELMDIGASRLKHMDAVGIEMQVLSLTQPGVQAFPAAIAVPMARDANARMHEGITAHPTRFPAFAALATADPAEAVKELERCVTKLGFKGA